MSHQRVEAGAGWTWITQGWDIFMKNPGIWIVLALILGIVYFVLSFIPLLGGLAIAVLYPALFGGLLYGARELDHDRSLEIPYLFQAFQDSDRTVPMILLGLVPLAGQIVLFVIGAIVFAGAAGTALMTGSADVGAGMLVGGGLIFILVSLVIGIIVGALLMFAVPRVMFGHAEPIPALKESLQAVLANIGAYVVFALIVFLLSILAAIPFGLGFLILMPVMAGAVYSANKQVFGGNDPTEEMPSSPPPGGAEESPPEEESPKRED